MHLKDLQKNHVVVRIKKYILSLIQAIKYTHKRIIHLRNLSFSAFVKGDSIEIFLRTSPLLQYHEYIKEIVVKYLITNRIGDNQLNCRN